MDIIFLPGNWLLSLFGAISAYIIIASWIVFFIYLYAIGKRNWTIIKAGVLPDNKVVLKTLAFLVVPLYLSMSLGTNAPRIALKDTTAGNAAYVTSIKSADIKSADPLGKSRTREDFEKERKRQEEKQNTYWRKGDE